MHNRLCWLRALAKAAVFALLFWLFVPACGWAASHTPNAIVIVIDGARYSETFGDPTHRNIPRIWNDLRPQGTIHTEFYNHGQTSTLGAHATMLCGNKSWIKFPEWNSEPYRPGTPTLFEYLRAATGADATQAYMVGNWGIPQLAGVTCSLHPNYGTDYGATWLRAPYEDEGVVQVVADVMDQYHPRLLIANLHGVDKWGHEGNWTKYLERIKTADTLVYLLWKKIQSDPFYANQTTFIVTNDHGRHGRNFQWHGDCCTGCQHVMFLALGPQIASGQQLSAPRRYLEDIGPTLGWLMGIPMPYVADGEVMPELLTAAPGEPPTQYLPIEGLEVSLALRDASGAPRTAFWPGERAFLDAVVVSRADKELMLYERTWNSGLCPSGEVCQRGTYYGPSPLLLAPDGYLGETYEVPLQNSTPPGEYPIVLEWRSVDAAGDLVHGAGTVTIAIEPPAAAK